MKENMYNDDGDNMREFQERMQMLLKDDYENFAEALKMMLKHYI